jgi:hypothetical protein
MAVAKLGDYHNSIKNSPFGFSALALGLAAAQLAT